MLPYVPKEKRAKTAPLAVWYKGLDMLANVADTECQQKKLKHYDFIHKITLKFLTT